MARAGLPGIKSGFKSRAGERCNLIYSLQLLKGGAGTSTFLEKASQVLGEEKVKQLRTEGYIAAQIKMRRQELGYSQQQLADKTGLQKSTIGRIEAGLNSPSLTTLLIILEGLDMDLTIEGRDAATV